MDYRIVPTPELRIGDIVFSHGMRILIDRAPSEKGNREGCFSTRSLILNREEIPNALVPFSWTLEPNGEHRWTIQGNELAHWYVEGAQA